MDWAGTRGMQPSPYLVEPCYPILLQQMLAAEKRELEARLSSELGQRLSLEAKLHGLQITWATRSEAHEASVVGPLPSCRTRG